MSSYNYDFNKNINRKNGGATVDSKPRQPNRQVRNPYSERQLPYGYNGPKGQSQVISGYFVREKSYKEIIISRINTALYCFLAFLVLVCLVSYYFVVADEMELRKLSRETVALNLDSAEMQNKLDNLQSLSNVDKQVARTNILQRAKQVIELSAADLPDVDYDKNRQNTMTNKNLGY